MTKAIFVVIVAAILLTSSCSKTTPSANLGSWTFKGVSYPNLTCYDITYGLSASSQSNSNSTSYSSLQVWFHDYPMASGSYAVVPDVNPALPGEASIVLTTQGQTNHYRSTGNGGLDSVHVAIVNGKVNISGTAIALQNVDSASDVSVLTFNITHQ